MNAYDSTVVDEVEHCLDAMEQVGFCSTGLSDEPAEHRPTMAEVMADLEADATFVAEMEKRDAAARAEPDAFERMQKSIDGLREVLERKSA